VIIGEPIPSLGKDPRQLNEEIRRSIEAGLQQIASGATGGVLTQKP
jgi:hypothetical protein